MRKTVATLLAALAAFILILCIAFTAVTLTAGNFSFFESEFKELGIPADMNISTSDLSQAVQAMVGYMNGTRDSIDVDVMIRGERTPMFALEIEHTHMKEVRSLWQTLSGMRGIALLLSAILALVSVMFDRKEYKENVCRGYLWGFGFFLLLFAFAGTWAGLNFNSFWNFFHKIIFPSSETWLLPAESRMIRMLPEQLFADVTKRCALLMLLPALLIAGGAVAGLVLGARRAAKAAGLEDVVNVEAEEEDEMLSVGEPDLIFVHKKANMPVSRRKQLEQVMAERNAMEEKADKLRSEEDSTLGEKISGNSSEDALKVRFEPFVPDDDEDDTDDEDDEE